jgi:Cu-processing system permease protein
LGFGVAGVVIAAVTGQLLAPELWRALGFFIASATLLGWVFIAFAYLVSTIASEKSRAAGLALIVWFFFVLVFDLGLLGILVGTQGAVSAQVFPYLLLLNPADVFRLANLAGFEAAQAYSGLISVATAQLFRPSLLLGVLTIWTVLPFSVAALLFQRRVP